MTDQIPPGLAAKTILVTGGAGFIGSNFILYLVRKYPDYQIINLDDLTYAGNLGNLADIQFNPNYRFYKGNICDQQLLGEIFQEEQITHVVNFAAQSHVDRSIINPGIFVYTNVLGTANLLDMAKRFWTGKDGFKRDVKFLQISTDEVYGSLGENGLFFETTALDPHSPYSASKAAADLLVKSYYDTFGFPMNITRCSNNYGPYQFPEKLIPLIINNALQLQPLPVYGDGLHVRDWLYVEDHCTAIDLVLHSGRAGEVYNIGGGNERQNLQVVNEIIHLLHNRVNKKINRSLINFIEDRKGHDRRYAVDASKIKKELGWRPRVPFGLGIEKTVQWYLAHKTWTDAIASGEYRNFIPHPRACAAPALG
jgi:dTDP-glucose 4,6-dehydratase